MWVEIAIVVTLTVVNGLLAMSELAVVSARPARLKALEDQGVTGARRATALAADPGRFLSAVQIGITLVGVLSGAFSGATLGARLSAWLLAQGLPAGLAEPLGVGIVVAAITYLSLVIGELVPKQVALADPEGMACRAAPAMTLLAKAASPLVWLLDRSGDLVLALLGKRERQGARISDEEVKTVIAEAARAGVIAGEEREMIGGVMRLADRSARALMTPRADVEAIAADLADEPLRLLLAETRRSRLPVRAGGEDDIVGVVLVKDALAALATGQRLDIRSLAQPAPILTDRAPALDVLQAIRAAPVRMALIFDEYGHFEGVVTGGDVLEAIAGDFDDGDDPPFVQREDGSFLVAGAMPIDAFADRIGVAIADRDGYATVAGLVLAALNRLPKPGERLEAHGLHFEVADLDGRRIDKLIVRRLQT